MGRALRVLRDVVLRGRCELLLPVRFTCGIWLFHRTVRNYGGEPRDPDWRLFYVFLSHGGRIWAPLRATGVYFFSRPHRRLGLPLHAALIPLCDCAHLYHCGGLDAEIG